MAFVGVFFIFCFGMGKVINTAILKSDGPPNKWNQIGTQPSGKRQDLTSNAVMEQQQLNQMVQRFPRLGLQMDDGDQEIAEMHAREDLLLDHYSWIDRSSGKVRIPIARAMEIIVRGSPGSSRGADRTIDGRRQGSGGDHAAYGWICPDGVRTAVHGDLGAAADAGRKAGRASGSGSEPLAVPTFIEVERIVSHISHKSARYGAPKIFFPVILLPGNVGSGREGPRAAIP